MRHGNRVNSDCLGSGVALNNMALPQTKLMLSSDFPQEIASSIDSQDNEDVSKRKGDEANAKDEFRSLLNSIPDGFCIIQVLFEANLLPYDYRFLHVNASFEHQTGLSDVVGRTIRELFPNLNSPDEHLGIEMYGRVALTGDPARFEERSLHLEHNYDVYAFRVGSPGEHRVGVLFHIIDKQSRQPAEIALRESEERFRLVVDSVEDYAIITMDAEGVITSWNPGAEKAFGWLAPEVLGKSCDFIFTPQDRENGIPQKERDTAFRTGRAEDERFHIRKDGTRFYVSGVMTLLHERGERSLVKIARDQTERIRTENALRDSEARFRNLSDAIPQIVWANEANGKAIYFNRRWLDYTGLTYEDSVGLGWQAVIHREDILAAVDRWQNSLLHGEVFECEFRMRRADGVYRWHIARNVPMRDQEGNVTGWFGSATDIHDLKQAETELQYAQEALEDRVEQRTRQLAQALAQLKGEVEQRRNVEVARAELVKRIVTTQEEERGRISRELHDNLGQYLTAVMLGLQALEMEVAQMMGGQRKTSLPQLGNLRGLVDELMKAVHRQAWELRPAELDAMGVATALEQYVGDWSARTSIPCDFQAVTWDMRPSEEIETTLYRVVQEALTNVARHANATRVDVVLEQNQGCASAIIEDNGKGFDLTTRNDRLGILGMRERLAIVEGQLEIESAPGEGTTVFVRVPLQIASVVEAEM